MTDPTLFCNIANIVRGKQLRNDPVRIGRDTVYISLYSVESMCALVIAIDIDFDAYM